MPCRRFIIWGSAGHAKVLHDLIQDIGGSVGCLVDNDAAAVGAIPGVPLVVGEPGLREWLRDCGDPTDLVAAIAIGGIRGEDRRSIAALFRTLGISLPPLIHSRATCSPSASIGEGSQILANSVIAADCSLGDSVIINHCANVDHECRLDDGVHIAPGAVLCGCISVARDAFIGAGATVLPRLTIGEGAVIGAGAVVTKHVPARTTVVGVPARPVHV